MTKRIGFIGAGMMGSGICKSLLRAGYAVTVIAHRNRAPIDELLGLGATRLNPRSDLAAGADVIMLCVDRAETVEAIMAGLASGLRSGQYVIDVTTGKPETSTKLASSLAANGVTYIDAPVTGAPVHAAAGQLASMVGASPAAFEAVRPVLDAYSAQVLVFGPTGAGITAKLLNNFVTQSSVPDHHPGVSGGAAQRRRLGEALQHHAERRGPLRLARAHHQRGPARQLQGPAVFHRQRLQGYRLRRRADRGRSRRRAHSGGCPCGLAAAGRTRASATASSARCSIPRWSGRPREPPRRHKFSGRKYRR